MQIEALQREIKDLAEQEKKLKLRLDEISAIKQNKQKEVEKLMDDSYTSDALARLYEQRRSIDIKRKK